jgi:hypothetical protein
MSAPDFGPQLLAFQALCALDSYEASIQAVVAKWLDMDTYAAASQELDRIRTYIATVPGLAAPWVTVLVSHTELVHALWRCEREHAHVGDNEQEILADHLQAVRYLQARCRRAVGPARMH